MKASKKIVKQVMKGYRPKSAQVTKTVLKGRLKTRKNP